MANNRIPQAQRSQEKKQQIYETSMGMFREKGYNQTTIRDICAAADITIGTFYNFFGDKFGILQEHFKRLTEKRSVFLEFTEEKLSNPYQAICDYFCSMAVLSNHIGKEFYREFCFRSPEMTAGIAASTTGNGIHHISLFLSKAQDRGSVSTDTNTWRTAEYLAAGYMGMVQYWLNFSNGESLEEIARRMLPMIFSAVTTQGICADAHNQITVKSFAAGK